MDSISTTRRDLLATALLSALPMGFTGASASPLNPEQTIIKLPGQLEWKPNPAYPEKSSDLCPLTGDTKQPGLYYTLIRWWPGFMSAPYTYTTDRFCTVLSGTWFCNSGAAKGGSCGRAPTFQPAACISKAPAMNPASGIIVARPSLLTTTISRIAQMSRRR